MREHSRKVEYVDIVEIGGEEEKASAGFCRTKLEEDQR